MLNFAGGNSPSPQPGSPKVGSDVEPSPRGKEEETGQDVIGPKLEEEGENAGPQEEEEDPSRSEGIVHFVIRDFSKMPEQLLSEPTYVRNLPWSVMELIN